VLKKSDDGEYNSRYYAGYDGGRCYLEGEQGRWLVLIADKMPPDSKTETGLFTSTPMSYQGEEYIKVPAGEFKTAKLLYGTHHEESGIPLVGGWMRDGEYWEYYAAGVGLVYRRHHWKKCEWVGLLLLPVDEGSSVFELTSYDVHRGEN
jgi:hypothetical protein